MADITYTTTAAPMFRAYNRCKFDIGIVTAQGRQYNIKPDSFVLLTMDDIAYIDSICRKKKLFGSGMLEAVDANGKPLNYEQMGVVEDVENKILSDDEISAALKKPLKAFSEWLEGIEDPVELHAIYMVATKMDLPSSKIKVLKAKMPDKDWLDEMD